MTKAANRKKKRLARASNGGRPRQEGARTPSGQLSRAGDANAKAIRETAVQARIRLAASEGELIDEKEALDPRRGYPAGRKCLSGHFGKGENANKRLQAGIDTAATIRRCMGILGYPPPTSQAMDMGRVRGLPIEGLNHSQQTRIAKDVLMKIEGILGSAGNGCRSAFRQLFIQEEECCEWWTDDQNAIVVKALDALIEG